MACLQKRVPNTGDALRYRLCETENYFATLTMVSLVQDHNTVVASMLSGSRGWDLTGQLFIGGEITDMESEYILSATGLFYTYSPVLELRRSQAAQRPAPLSSISAQIPVLEL